MIHISWFRFNQNQVFQSGYDVILVIFFHVVCTKIKDILPWNSSKVFVIEVFLCFDRHGVCELYSWWCKLVIKNLLNFLSLFHFDRGRSESRGASSSKACREKQRRDRLNDKYSLPLCFFPSLSCASQTCILLNLIDKQVCGTGLYIGARKASQNGQGGHFD